MNEKPVVFVVDDDQAVRSSLQFLIESAGLPVTAFADAHEFLHGYDPKQPGCLVLDARMPGMTGLELQQQLTATGIRIPVIIVTGFGDVPNAVQAMRAGAIDFIEKPYDSAVLLEKVRQAIELDRVERGFQTDLLELQSRIATLSAREREVMERVVNGLANKDIAGNLGISTKTVEAHRSRVMDKMKAESLAQLVRLVEATRTRPFSSPLRSARRAAIENAKPEAAMGNGNQRG